MKHYAVRNIARCTKDCLCLYVCPTGATDTETGQVDAGKCIGCGDCAAACPSHAISMVPKVLPPQQPKTDAVQKAMKSLSESKTRQEQIALHIAAHAEDPQARKLAAAFAKSNRLMAEDLLRESGYMLPQSRAVHTLLLELTAQPPAEFPADTVRALLQRLQVNE